MEKKNSNRGLEEISNIFLSSGKKDDKKLVSGLSAVTIRTDSSCMSCINLIIGSSRELKCRIFTFEYEKYSVPHLSTIDTNYANYCENYEPEQKDKKLNSIQPIGLAKGAAPAPTNGDVNIKELAAIISELDQNYSEIEQSRTVHNKISYENTDTAKEDMKRAMFRFIENGYTILSVELSKRTEISKQKGKEINEEMISLFVKK